MGRLIDVSNIRVKPQYMQDVMGIAMIRCEDLSRILADVPTVEAIPKADYENQLKTDLVAMLTELKTEIKELDTYDIERVHGLIENGYISKEVEDLIQQKINFLSGL